MKIMSKKVLIIVIFLAVVSGLIGFFNISVRSDVSDVIANNPLKISEIQDIPFRIVIDNNWSDTRDAYDWCYGLGTEQEPYIIENISLDLHNIQKYYAKPYLEIRNTNESFIISNSIFSNMMIPHYGIFLYNVSNGKIDNCQFLDTDGTGIKVENSENIIISDNLIYYKQVEGSYEFMGPGIHSKATNYNILHGIIRRN